MSGVKNWLMEMQEYSQYILEVRDVPTARKMFIDKYELVSQVRHRKINLVSVLEISNGNRNGL